MFSQSFQESSLSEKLFKKNDIPLPFIMEDVLFKKYQINKLDFTNATNTPVIQQQQITTQTPLYSLINRKRTSCNSFLRLTKELSPLRELIPSPYLNGNNYLTPNFRANFQQQQNSLFPHPLNMPRGSGVGFDVGNGQIIGANRLPLILQRNMTQQQALTNQINSGNNGNNQTIKNRNNNQDSQITQHQHDAISDLVLMFFIKLNFVMYLYVVLYKLCICCKCYCNFIK